MRKNLTNYTNRELSLIVLNDDNWYNMIGSEDFLEAIDVAFIYTDEQMKDLLETVHDEILLNGYGEK